MTLAWQPTPNDLEFHRVYGPWQPWTPAQALEEMHGFAAPWWIAGGYAIEAFTGIPRFHEDLDLILFGRDVKMLRLHLRGRYHLWSNHDGIFRVMDDVRPEPLDPHCQIWVREHALGPWLADCILNPDSDGRYQARRYADMVCDLDDITWVRDGVRYLNPEAVLLFKAHLTRPKDGVDLANTLPLLGGDAREWLHRELATRFPDHRWLAKF